MPVTVTCTCGKGLVVADEIGGQPVVCPSCGITVNARGAGPYQNTQLASLLDDLEDAYRRAHCQAQAELNNLRAERDELKRLLEERGRAVTEISPPAGPAKEKAPSSAGNEGTVPAPKPAHMRSGKLDARIAKKLNRTSWNLVASRIAVLVGGIAVLATAGVWMSGCFASRSRQRASEAETTLKQIERLGGKPQIDENSPERPIVGVSFANTSITDDDLAVVKQLSRLERLDLTGCKVINKGLADLQELTQLESLILFNTGIDDQGLRYCRGLTKLKNLDLNHTKVSDAGLPHLRSLTQLESLDLGGTQVTDAGLANLRGLKTLQAVNLNNTEITDIGLGHLKALSSLEWLHLKNTKVTAAGITELRKALPRLENISN